MTLRTHTTDRAQRMGPALITLTFIIASIGVMSACSGVLPYDCVQRCENDRDFLLQHAYRPDDQPLDEETLCTRDAVVEAGDQCACKAAYRDDFRVLPSDLVCGCPEDGETIALLQDDCDYALVPADLENCSEYESPGHRLQTRQCFGPQSSN